MQKLWQLKKLSTNEKLNEPQPLPQDWGPIIGMGGFVEKLNDLTWVGMPDLGWFVVKEVDLNLEENKQNIIKQIENIIYDTNEKVAIDNKSISRGERENWVEYRRLIREIPYQTGFPNEINWPKKPD